MLIFFPTMLMNLFPTWKKDMTIPPSFYPPKWIPKYSHFRRENSSFLFYFFWWIIAMLATIFLSSSQRRIWNIFVVEQLSDPWAKIQGLLNLLAFWWWWWWSAVDFRKVLVRIANLFIYILSKYILSACNQKTLKWALGKQEWSHHTWVPENPMENTPHYVQCLHSVSASI